MFQCAPKINKLDLQPILLESQLDLQLVFF